MSCGKCSGQCDTPIESSQPIDAKIHVLELRVRVLESYLSNVSKQLLIMEEILKKLTSYKD